MAFLDETGLAELWELIKGQDDLVKDLANTKAQIKAGSYTGTGTYGSSNPNRLTFDFAPKFFFLIAGANGIGINVSNNSMINGILWIAGQTSFQNGNTQNTISVTGNTISWYNTMGADYQYNHSGTVYNYIAIG